MNESNLKIGGYKTINEFVKAKIEDLKNKEQSFKSLFESMFSLDDNIICEEYVDDRLCLTTYKESKEKIDELASSISSLIIENKGAVIGLALDNSLLWIEMFWAILKSGYTPLLLNRRLDSTQLNDALKKVNAIAVISSDMKFDVKTITPETILSNENKAVLDNNFENKVYFMTSGTSGDVKLCLYDGERICHQIYNSYDIILDNELFKLHYNERLKQLAFLPFYHIFGFLACYMWFGFFGRTFVFLKDYKSDTILNTIRKHEITHIFAVPLFFTEVEKQAKLVIAKRGDKTLKRFNKAIQISNKLSGSWFAKKFLKEVRDNLFGDSISIMVCGGGEIPKHTLEFFNGLGYPLVEGYGASEIGITSVNLSNKKKNLNSGSVGFPLKSVQYEESNGELLVKGKSIAKEIIYKDKVLHLNDDEYLHTGDLVSKNKYGYFINGRLDDLIISVSGENLSPAIIESNLNIPNAEIVLLNLKNENGENKATLLVHVEESLKDSIPKIKEEIVSQLKEKKYLSFVNEIRFTFVNLLKDNEFKLKRKRITKDIEEGRMSIFKETGEEVKINILPTIDKEILEKVASIFSISLGKEITSYDANFFYDLNGDSLSFYDLIEKIKDEFDVEISEEKTGGLLTVNEIAMYIQRMKNNG